MNARATGSRCFALFVSTALAAAAPACGPSNGTAGSSGGGDAGPASDAAFGSDAASIGDVVDAANPVMETPAPGCHDLVQRGERVPLEPVPGASPKPHPLAAMAPGFYVLVSDTAYGTTGPVLFTPTRQTVYVSLTRFYLLIDGEDYRVSETLEWSLRDGMLERKYVCSSVGNQKSFVRRIDATDDGFTIYNPDAITAGEYEAARYVRVE